jgi:hypothetical protein
MCPQKLAICVPPVWEGDGRMVLLGVNALDVVPGVLSRLGVPMGSCLVDCAHFLSLSLHLFDEKKKKARKECHEDQRF